MKNKIVLAFAALTIPTAVLAATVQPETSPTAAALARWRAQRFGLFIHWGPVALTGTQISWSRGGEGPGYVPLAEYDRLYTKFNPTNFHAAAWARTAQAAGMKYLVITTKHCDGFCLWPTKFTDYHIGNTPFQRDVLKELSAACRQQGVQFSAYYSLSDWFHPDWPHGSPGGRGQKRAPHLPRYIEYLKNQTRELIEHYGPLGELWLDTGDALAGYTHGQEIYDHLKTLQPSLLVNDRVYINRQHHTGDFDTIQYEGRLGGFNRARPWEACTVLGGLWSWSPTAATHTRSLQECVQMLLRIVGNDGNFLLNVGPRADGTIEPIQVTRLKEIGAWLRRYGAGVYGTRGGPFKAGHWGAATCRQNKIYLFIMNWPATGPLQLPALPVKLTRHRTLSGGRAQIQQTATGLTVALPAANRDPIATVIELTVAGQAFDIPPATVLNFLRADPPPVSPAVRQALETGRLDFTVKPRGPFTIAALVNAAEFANGPGQTVLGTELYGLSIGDGNAVVFSVKEAAGPQHYYLPADAYRFTAGAWHHLAGTYDGVTMRLYLDGEELGPGLAAKFTALPDAARPFGPGHNFRGQTRDARLYDRALAPEEIAALVITTHATESNASRHSGNLKE